MESPKEHKLPSPFHFWFLDRKSMKPSGENYAECIKPLPRMNTVEDFWRVYSWMVRPGDQQTKMDYFCFRIGVRPMWEDKENADGGKLSVLVRKHFANRCWEEVLMAVVGDSYNLGDAVCGVTISLKFHGFVLSVWMKSTDDDTVEKVRTMLLKTLNISDPDILEFRAHNEVLRRRARKESQTGDA